MKALLTAVIVALVSPEAKPDSDVLFDAMKDEMSRSVAQLKIEKHDKPYYVSYRVDDVINLDIAASFGAFIRDKKTRDRTLAVDVHVGEYKLDSGNMRSYFWDDYDDQKLSIVDDYDAIRHKLWLKTDSAYKNAVQNLERKKAILQQQNLKDRPNDWSKEEPLVLVQPKREFTVDRAAWKERVKTLSALFKEYPKIRQSTVDFHDVLDTRYFVNSEGSVSRVNEEMCTVTATATAQANDGMKITDSILIAVLDTQHMPPTDQIESKIKHLAEHLSQAIEAKECDIYQGPVMFEGEAAASFFAMALAPNVVVRRPSDEEHVTEYMDQARIGRRILPKFINVVDDPLLKDEAGNRLVGCSEIDGQGVKVQPVALVEKGILKTLLATRLPTHKVDKSNGHALDSMNNARISNLIIQTDQPLNKAAMKEKLMELGKEDALEYVLVVRKLRSAVRSDSPFSFWIFGGFSGSTRKGAIDLPLAVDCARIYLSDGHEEPVRGSEFAALSLRILRDIAAAGDDAQIYPESDGATCISTPSIILRDVEVQKSHASPDKLPVLLHPFFDKQ